MDSLRLPLTFNNIKLNRYLLPLASILYTLGIHGYGLLLRFAAWFHPKARLWVKGRRNWKGQWAHDFPTEQPVVWVHCASLGEFEQARPLMEHLRASQADVCILLTFFSPSGFEIRKDYSGADVVQYLPLDTPAAMRWLVQLVQPRLVLVVKYELWLNWLRALVETDTPVVMVSARLTERSGFQTSAIARLYAQALIKMDHIFAQDVESQTRFQQWLGTAPISLGGDTRYDRVMARAQNWQARPAIEAFVNNRFCIVAGSTWGPDEDLLFAAWQAWPYQAQSCLIIAPHEIHPAHIQAWRSQFPEETLIYSQQPQPLSPEASILWIDTIGMLGDLYAYADVAYVGGAFGSGLHNILEPATFGCPILFGPNHQRFPEATTFIEAGGAFSVKEVSELTRHLQRLYEDRPTRAAIRRTNKDLVQAQAGATQRLVAYLTEAHGYPTFE